ncbi:MAG TPA: YnfA family protein [Phototrophicaceae bacterium]|nr:YnfA family protein [Phototrophicaceae bacterium]
MTTNTFQGVILFMAAAVFELGGAYLIWQWQRTGKSILWAFVGVVSLFIYGLIQTKQAFGFGRAFAAYGGVFIVGAMVWGWLIDGHIPDRWDVIGGLVCLIGVGIILLVPRT